MKKLLVLLVVLVVCSSPVLAQYERLWYDDFESYNVGDPLSVHGYQTPSGALSMVVGGGGGGKYAQQVAGSTKSASARNLQRPGNWSGYVKFWIYDPLSGSGTDTRVGVHSSYGVTWQVLSANVRDLDSSTYWRGQWTYSSVSMDGVSTASSSLMGYTFQAGQAAPRAAGWNCGEIRWAFDYGAGSCHVEWFINQSSQPNLQLDFISTSPRWLIFHDVAGLYMGSQWASDNPGMVDNVEFWAVPEPSSLLALGCSLVGLAGFIRRSR